MRHATLGLLAAGACLLPPASAADTETTVTAHEIDEAMVIARVLQPQRSVERYQSGPYATLLAQEEAAALPAMINGFLDQQIPGGSAKLHDLLPSITGFSLSVALGGGEGMMGMQPRAVAALGSDQAPAIFELIKQIIEQNAPGDISVIAELPAGVDQAFTSSNGQAAIMQIGELLLLNGGGTPQADFQVPAKRAEAVELIDASADLEMHADYGPMVRAMRQAMGQFLAQMPPEQAQQMNATWEMMEAFQFDLTLALTDFGLEEHYRMAEGSKFAQLVNLPEQPLANRELLASLPASTIMAWTGAIAPEAIDAQREALGESMMAMIEQNIDPILAQKGLPPTMELAKAFAGDVLFFATEPPIAGGIPSLNVVLPATEDIAQSLLTLCGSFDQVQQSDAGVLSGRMMQMIPWQFGYRDGKLIATTDPAGLDAATQRGGGFLEQPQITAALTHVPDNTVSLGLSRSQQSWGALTSVVVPLLQLQGVQHPALGLLPKIGQNAQFGFLYQSKDGDLGSGGMVTALSSGFVFGLAGSQMLAPRIQAGPPPEDDFNDF